MAKNKKILVISDYTDYHSTRPEASIFLELSKMGFEIHIMTPSTSTHNQSFKNAGIKVIDFHPKTKFNIKETKTIRKYIIEHEIELVHLFNSRAIFQGIRAAKNTGAKVVLYRGYAGNIHRYNPFSYLKFLHPRVDRIFCNSIGVEAYLKRHLLFGKEKAIAINKGHNVNWYSGIEKADLRKELNLKKEAFLLVNVCNNRKMKGIPYLLKAFMETDPKLDLHLILIGRNFDNYENLKILSGSEHQSKIHMLGFRKDALSLVKACNCFVLSSIKGESITKSVIESMSLETPAIITDIPGNVELLKHEESGLVVQAKNHTALAEAIKRIYSDTELYQKLKTNCKRHISEELNHIQTAEKTANLYNDLIN